MPVIHHLSKPIRMNTFDYKNLTVEVTVDIDHRCVQYENADGIIIKYSIDRFVPDLSNKKIYVGYVREMIGKASGQIIRADKYEYIEPNYTPFYHVVPPISIGEFSSKSILNGLIRRLPEFGGSLKEPGVIVCFKMPDGTFFQPVVLDEPTVTNATEGQSDGSITVNVSDGVAPYQYQLDGGTLQPSNEFTGLAEGTYTIRVEDAEGNWREQTVTVGVLVAA